MLGAQRVFEHHRHKHLGRKKRQAGVLQVDRAVGNRVAQLHAAVGGKADDVTGIGFFHRLAALAHKGDHAGGAQLFGGADDLELHARRVLARSHAHKGDAVAVVGVHIGLHLEDHAAKGLVLRLHFLHHRLAVDLHGAGAALRRGCQIHQSVQHFHHTKVVHARAKKHRGLFACQKGGVVPGGGCAGG